MASSSASAASVSRCGRGGGSACGWNGHGGNSSGSGSSRGGGRRSGAAGSGCNGHEPLPCRSRAAEWRAAALRCRRPDGRRDVARRCDRAHDIGFDDDVGRAADHQQMFDIVAPDQNEPAAAVDAGVIDHGKPRLAAARAGRRAGRRRTGAPPKRSRRSARARSERRGRSARRAASPRRTSIKHPRILPVSLPARPLAVSQRLTAPVTFAAVNTNKN